MNTGIQDTHNLIWKLAAATRLIDAGEHSLAETLLCSYEEERRPNADAMVSGTGKATKMLTKKRNLLARGFISLVLPRMVQFKKEDFAQPVAMLKLTYEQSSLIAAGPGCGSRVPNPELQLPTHGDEAKSGGDGVAAEGSNEGEGAPRRLHGLLRHPEDGGGHSLVLLGNGVDGASCNVCTLRGDGSSDVVAGE
jgi:hypothetical protein